MISLTFILACPLIAAIVVALLPRGFQFLFRLLALAATLLSLVGAVLLFLRFEPGAVGYQFECQVPWVDSLGLSYHVGVDGLNVGLILMAALVAFAAAAVSWEIKDRQKEYYFLLLLMAGGILGAFASLDLFFFYFFHELALVPTFIMIGVWGRGPDKNYATFKMTLYLSLGALIALLGLIVLYVAFGGWTLDIPALTRQAALEPLATSTQNLIFPLLLFGFGILVSLWPFHTWAPLGYEAAPTATAMLHAGVLKKFGLYGLIRIALRQKDLNLLLGNSSVAHMGFAFLGIASLSVVGLTGAVVVMVAHGLLAAVAFGLSGYLYRQTGTLRMDQMGGLLRRLPFLGSALVMAMLAGCGLPGFANFPGEVLVLFGAWDSFGVVVTLAAWGALIIGAVYMLRAIRQVLHGPLPEQWSELGDAPHLWRKLPYALLLAALLVFGCFPRLLTDRINPNAGQIVQAATGHVARPPAHKPPAARGLAGH
jgi:NADH-quinone oxidoreductase subunit M